MNNRKRGAQPGNTNALKHGFYTRRIHKHDLSGVEDTNIKGLIDEIALIRIFTRKLIESSVPSSDPYELAGVLRAICMASATITRIIKAQTFLANDRSDFNAMIDEAIRLARIDLGMDPPPPPLPEL